MGPGKRFTSPSSLASLPKPAFGPRHLGHRPLRVHLRARLHPPALGWGGSCRGWPQAPAAGHAGGLGRRALPHTGEAAARAPTPRTGLATSARSLCLERAAARTHTPWAGPGQLGLLPRARPGSCPLPHASAAATALPGAGNVAPATHGRPGTPGAAPRRDGGRLSRAGRRRARRPAPAQRLLRARRCPVMAHRAGGRALSLLRGRLRLPGPAAAAGGCAARGQARLGSSGAAVQRAPQAAGAEEAGEGRGRRAAPRRVPLGAWLPCGTGAARLSLPGGGGGDDEVRRGPGLWSGRLPCLRPAVRLRERRQGITGVPGVRSSSGPGEPPPGSSRRQRGRPVLSRPRRQGAVQEAGMRCRCVGLGLLNAGVRWRQMKRRWLFPRDALEKAQGTFDAVSLGEAKN